MRRGSTPLPYRGAIDQSSPVRRHALSSTLVAIPVHNERKYVAGVLDKVRRFHDQVLFVDDASTDGTGEFLASQRGIHLVRHPTNMGYGRAIIDAFDYAHANGFDWVITMDCDEQHEPEMIPAFLREIAQDPHDVISGSRYTDHSLNDDLAPGDRRLINRTVTSVVNDLFDWHLTDTFCGFKAHRVSAMKRLRLDEAGYAFPLQLWPRVYAAGLSVKEIAVKRIYNDPTRTFGGNLDDANKRLRHYMDVLKRELLRIGHADAACMDHVTLEEAYPCGCP
jgi:glycosyltransferase involved in cell wall biosynthesis